MTYSADPFKVAFVETAYTVSESEGQVEVCVNLTQPQRDILDETISVNVYNDDSSSYIPIDAILASKTVQILYYIVQSTVWFQHQTPLTFLENTAWFQ